MDTIYHCLLIHVIMQYYNSATHANGWGPGVVQHR